MLVAKQPALNIVQQHDPGVRTQAGLRKTLLLRNTEIYYLEVYKSE